MSEPVAVVQLGGRSFNIARTLGEINLDNLIGEVQSVGGEAIWWGILSAQASTEAARVGLALDVVKAVASRRIRSQAIQAGEKLTEKGLEELLALDLTMQEAQEARLTAEEKSNIFRSVRFAVDQKARTLETLASQIGQEHRASQPPFPPFPRISERHPADPPPKRVALRP